MAVEKPRLQMSSVAGDSVACAAVEARGQRESAKEGDGADEQFNMSHIVAVHNGGREVVLDTGSAAVSFFC